MSETFFPKLESEIGCQRLFKPGNTLCFECGDQKIMYVALDPQQKPPENGIFEPQWISVEDRMPEPDKDVLLCYEWTGRSGSVYREVELCSLSAFNETSGNFRAISWMPLPDPPEV